MPTAKKLPSGSWRCRAFIGVVDGKKKYKSFTASTKKEAERMAAAYNYKQAAPITFRQAFTTFYASRKDVLSPTTARNYANKIDGPLKPIADLQLAKLDAVTLQNFISSLSVKYAPKTIFNIWGIITSVLKQQGIDPPKILLPQKKKAEISIPSDNDVKAILSAAETDPELYTCILLGAFCGLRRSEICALDNADTKTNTIRIDKASVIDPDNNIVLKAPKSSAGYRTIKVPAEICKRVADAIEKQGTAVQLTPGVITLRFFRMLKRNNLPHYRFHDLRHYCASSMIAQGIPDFYIVRYMGHQDDHMLKTVYGHIKKEKADVFADRMQDVFTSFNL